MHCGSEENELCETTFLPNGDVESYVAVDRKHLGHGLIGGGFGEKLMSDEMGKIMQLTNTRIVWPLRMRPNIRGKKDSMVKVIGTPENVDRAKSYLNSEFEARKLRITLKMDVAFTDHSHIIGKGGRSIQTVMNDTNCHIHFPDSNRTNTFEKSNQVSIAGSAAGAEKARCRIRQLLPLTVYYDLPLACFPPQAFDATNPVIQAVQQNFGVVVSLKQLRENSFAVDSFNGNNYVRMSVRGTRSQVLGLRQSIALLLDQLTNGSFSFNTTAVTLDTEVAAQHHAFLMGRGNTNVRSIQQSHGVMVKFPDNTQNTLMAMPAASSVPLKRSTVSLTGANFDAVFMAWQEMLGFLPLVLIFDLKENEDVDAAMVTQMMEKLKISIIIKPKIKQNIKSIMVRGCEKDSRLLFEVRRQLLGLDASEVPYCCEQHYNNVQPGPVAQQPEPPTAVPRTALSASSIWATPARPRTVVTPGIENKDPNSLKLGLPSAFADIANIWSTNSENIPKRSTTSSCSVEDSPDTKTTLSEDSFGFGPQSRFANLFTPTVSTESLFSTSERPNYSRSFSSQYWNRLSSDDLDDYQMVSRPCTTYSSYDCFQQSRRSESGILTEQANNESNTDLDDLLKRMDLVRYADRLKGMSVSSILALTEYDLLSKGISAYEAQSVLDSIRRFKSICFLVNESARDRYEIAPGAGRKM